MSNKEKPTATATAEKPVATPVPVCKYDTSFVVGRVSVAIHESKTQNKEVVTAFERINENTVCACKLDFLKANKESSASSIDWLGMMNGNYKYAVIIPESGKKISGVESVTVKTRELKCSDVFSIKASKNSSKIAIDSGLLALIDTFGANLVKEYHGADSSRAIVKVYAKYSPVLSCFTCETSSSIGNLEKQYNEILKALSIPVSVRKSDVRFLSDCFNKAVAKRGKSAYHNGNALQLLDMLLIIAYESTKNHIYKISGKLESQKAPREK